MTATTKFGSLNAYEKGRVTIINDNPRNYVFSNVFKVADTSAPYERVAVGKNFEYVIEAFRAEGESPWYSAAHDEFVVAMDGEIEVHLVKLDNPDSVVAPDSQGAHRLPGDPKGRKMGKITLRRGHMALLPVGSAYRLRAAKPAAAIMQTILGPETVEKWATICQTKA